MRKHILKHEDLPGLFRDGYISDFNRSYNAFLPAAVRVLLDREHLGPVLVVREDRQFQVEVEASVEPRLLVDDYRLFRDMEEWDEYVLYATTFHEWEGQSFADVWSLDDVESFTLTRLVDNTFGGSDQMVFSIRALDVLGFVEVTFGWGYDAECALHDQLERLDASAELRAERKRGAQSPLAGNEALAALKANLLSK